MARSHTRPDQDEPDEREDEQGADAQSELSEAEAATREIVTIRRRMAELEQGRNAIPTEATEALEALDAREHQLRDRLAELQQMFSDPRLEFDVNVADELARTDQSSMVPRV